MSVKRYTPKINIAESSEDVKVQLWEVVDSDGRYVLHSDYAALLARYNTLVEAVSWMLYIDTPENFEGGKHIKARAEVDRLLSQEKP
jgi:hypothetical protein